MFLTVNNFNIEDLRGLNKQERIQTVTANDNEPQLNTKVYLNILFDSK